MSLRSSKFYFKYFSLRRTSNEIQRLYVAWCTQGQLLCKDGFVKTINKRKGEWRMKNREKHILKVYILHCKAVYTATVVLLPDNRWRGWCGYDVRRSSPFALSRLSRDTKCTPSIFEQASWRWVMDPYVRDVQYRSVQCSYSASLSHEAACLCEWGRASGVQKLLLLTFTLSEIKFRFASFTVLGRYTH